MDREEASSRPFTGFGEKNNFLTRGAGERKRKREIDKFLLIFNFQSSACSKWEREIVIVGSNKTNEGWSSARDSVFIWIKIEIVMDVTLGKSNK